MEIKKSTHNDRVELFMPIMKEANGKYIAVLSDDSVDRDEEKLSKGCVQKLGQDDGYLAALCNHKNDVFMQVAEWTNRGVKEIDGHSALIAEPKFFMSNPNAKIIKGMLDEGAKLGISIGAMVKQFDDVNGMRVYNELELIEASFVAIPSNRHGRAMAVAKGFNANKKISEEQTMDKSYTEKEFVSAIEKKVEEVTADFTKQLETKDAEITKVKDDLDASIKKNEEVVAEAEEAKAEAESKLEEAKTQIEVEKKVALEKQKFANEGGDVESNPEDVDKSLKEGMLPISRMM